MEAFLLPEGPEDSQQLLGVLRVRNPGAGITARRVGHVSARDSPKHEPLLAVNKFFNESLRSRIKG